MVVGFFYINVWFHQHIMAIGVLNNTTEYELNVQKLLVKRSEFKPQTENPALGLMSGDNLGVNSCTVPCIMLGHFCQVEG